MGYVYYNNNPCRKSTGDCVIRSIAAATGYEWRSTYMDLAQQGYEMCDLMNSNEVASAYLYKKGFRRHAIPYEKPDNYTIADFCYDNDTGLYILCTGSHFVMADNGDYVDIWDCGQEIPQYYFKKER